MVKVRLWGELAEVNKLAEIISTNPRLRVLSVSPNYSDRGASVYKRVYIDVALNEEVPASIQIERLTKRDSKGNALAAKTSTSTFVGEIYEENKVLEQERLERLADLEDKLESGQLVEVQQKCGC